MAATRLLASDALAAAPDFKEDSVDYADFSEYQTPEKILEKRVTRQGGWYLVKWKHSPDHDCTWEEGTEVMLQFPAVVKEFENKFAAWEVQKLVVKRFYHDKETFDFQSHERLRR